MQCFQSLASKDEYIQWYQNYLNYLLLVYLKEAGVELPENFNVGVLSDRRWQEHYDQAKMYSSEVIGIYNIIKYYTYMLEEFA